MFDVNSIHKTKKEECSLTLLPSDYPLLREINHQISYTEMSSLLLCDYFFCALVIYVCVFVHLHACRHMHFGLDVCKHVHVCKYEF